MNKSASFFCQWTLVVAGCCFWAAPIGFHAQDALDLVDLTVLVPAGGMDDEGNPAGLEVQEGDVLLSLVQGPTSMFAALLNDSAQLTWAEQTPFRGFYMKPWKEGEFVWYDYTLRKWTVVDRNWNVLDTLTQTLEPDDDYHDVHLFGDGSYLVVSLEQIPTDLSEFGGSSDATLLNPRLLHMAPDETILRQWSGEEEMPLDPLLDNLSFNTVDALHWNAVQVDAHGGLLLSMRNRNQIVRLRPEDWSIHWKLGGADSDFILDDPIWEGFVVQHDVQDLGQGRLLLFDNHVFDPEGEVTSRVLELELDTLDFTATRVWQFAHPDGVYGPSQGSAERLDNGNTLIAWGTSGGSQGTRVTEVTSDGDIAWEVKCGTSMNVYRARKYPLGMLSGCTDEEAWNASTSTHVLHETDCVLEASEAFGCLDPTAENYDPEALYPDNSCIYAVTTRVDFAQVEGSGDVDPSQAGYARLSSTGEVINSVPLSPETVGWQAAQFKVFLTQGPHFYAFVHPDGTVEDLAREVVLEAGGGAVDLGSFCYNELAPCLGCLDPMDVAYNPWAQEGGECEGFSLTGCTYPSATNFVPSATSDDGSCAFVLAAPCPGDLDEDGTVGIGDLLVLLANIGSICD